MFRRSRFSVRPNVSAASRAAAAPQETPAVNPDTPKEASESGIAVTVTQEANVSLPEKDPTAGDNQGAECSSSSAAVQRRKRFSVKPKVAPGRPPALPRTSKSPQKVTSVTPKEADSSDAVKPSTSCQTAAAATPQRLQSPRSRRHSESNSQQKPQPKVTPPPPESQTVPTAEVCLESAQPAPERDKKSESGSGGPVKTLLPRPPDKIPPSLPDREATELSEKARTLVLTKNMGSLSLKAFSLSRLLNSPSDVQRMVKAQKLRELLRQERCKEKNLKRAKHRSKEFDLDPTKMTMRDLIHYIPTSNPMSTSLEDFENETVVPLSPGHMEPPERAQQPTVHPTKTVSSEEEAAAAEGDDDEEESLMVPQVKVAADGSLIIDEESLTVEVQRAKGPNVIQDRDPIFERGSTTTYSSFRKSTYSKPWSIEETDMFFLAVSMVGTDFSMICQLFPHRVRSEIKNKFKREERENSWRVDKAFRDRRKLDIEYFSKLLEKVLENQRNKKKLKKLVGKSAPKKSKTRTKAKKSKKTLSDVEEEEEESEMPDLEGEEEQDGSQGNEGESISPPKTKRKRQKKSAAEVESEEPNNKKNKTGDAGTLEAAEATLPEEQPNSDMVDKVQDVEPVKEAIVKPAKLSRGRAPKPLVPLGLKRGKKPAAPAPKETEETEAEKEEETVKSKEDSHLDKSSECVSPSEDEEDVAPKPQKPTRYGRVPKPVKPLVLGSEEDDSQPSTTEVSPSAAKAKPKAVVKRRPSEKVQPQKISKRPKLVTLRSTKSDYSDEENDTEEQRLDRDAHSFVPSSLHDAFTEISEVDETIVELDILDSLPDVPGISHNALHPDSSWQQAQDETGSAEPWGHRLDSLVDVVDVVSYEPMEGYLDESYTEAAQTLLTIGSVAHVSQPSEGDALQDSSAGVSSEGLHEEHNKEEILPETSEIGPPAEQENVLLGSGDSLDTATTEQECAVQKDDDDECRTPTEKEKRQVTKGRSSKLKPKPNLSRTSRSIKPSSQSQSGGNQSATSVPFPQLPPQTSALTKDVPAPEEIPLDRLDSIAATSITLPRSDSQAQPDTESVAATEKLPGGTSLQPDPNPTQTLGKTSSEVRIPYEMTEKESLKESPAIATRSVDLPRIAESDPSSPENLNISQTQFKPGTEQATSEAGDTCENSSATKQPPATPSSRLDLKEKYAFDASKGVEPVSPSGGKTAAAELRKGRLQKVKPKPNIPHTLRGCKSKPPVVETAIQKTPAPTEETKLRTGTSTHEMGLDKTAESQSVEGNFCEVHPEPRQEKSSGKPGVSPNLSSPVEHERNMESEESGSPSTPPESREASTHSLEERKAPSQMQRIPKLKPKPNLPQTLRAPRSKGLSGLDLVGKESVEKSHYEDTDLVLTSPPSQDSALESVQELEKVQNTLTGALEQSGVNVAPFAQNCSTESTEFINDNQKFAVETTPCVSDVPIVDTKAKDVQEQSTCAVPVDVEESTVSNEAPQASSCLPARARLAKVKPKPNLTKTSRAVRSKSQTAEETVKENLSVEEEVKHQTEQTNVDSVPSPEESQLPHTRVVSTTREEARLGEDATSGSRGDNVLPDSRSEQTLLTQASPSKTSFDTPSDAQKSPAADCQEATRIQNSSPLRRLPKLRPKPNLAQLPRAGRLSHETSKAPDKDNSGCSLKPKVDTVVAATPPSVLSEKSSPEDSVQAIIEKVASGAGLSEHGNDQTTEEESRDSTSATLTHTPTGSPQKALKTASSEIKPPTHPVTLAQESDSSNKSGIEAESHTAPSPMLQKGSIHTEAAVSESPLLPNSSPKCAEESSLRVETNSEPVSKSEAMADNVPLKRQRISRVKAKPNIPPLRGAKRQRPTADANAKAADEEGTQTCTTVIPEKQPVDPGNNSKTEMEVEAGVPACSDTNSSKKSDSSSPPRSADPPKAPETAPPPRRARTAKPKPNLQRSIRSQQRGPDTAAVQSCSDLLFKDEGVTLDHGAASELRTNYQQPAEGASGQTNATHSSVIHPQPFAVPASELKKVPAAQNPSNPSAADVHPCPLLMEMLPEQVPSDPDEPFFILSLTEIPVPPAGEVVDGAGEQIPYLPVTDASARQASVSTESLVAAGEKSISDVPPCVSTKESGETFREQSTEAKAAADSSTAAYKTRKRQTKVETSATQKRTSRNAKKPPAQPESSGSAAELCRGQSEHNIGVEKAQPAAENRQTATPEKAKDFTPFLCKTSTSTSTSEKAAGSECGAQVAGSSDLPLSASYSGTQESACTESSSAEEEPTNVSQFFLTDIFTEVEEG